MIFSGCSQPIQKPDTFPCRNPTLSDSAILNPCAAAFGDEHATKLRHFRFDRAQQANQLHPITDIVNIRDARTNFSRLLDKAHNSEGIVIGKAGTPYARRVPLKRVKREPDFVNGAIGGVFFDSLPTGEFDAWDDR